MNLLGKELVRLKKDVLGVNYSSEQTGKNNTTLDDQSVVGFSQALSPKSDKLEDKKQEAGIDFELDAVDALSDARKRHPETEDVPINSNEAEQQTSDQNDPFADTTVEDRTRSALLLWKDSNRKHQSEEHKQDLLFYGILDVVGSSGTKLNSIIPKSAVEYLITLANKEPSRKPQAVSHLVVKEFVQELMKTATDAASCRREFQSIDQQEVYKKVASKLLKLMYKVQEENSLNKDQSELNYITEFMAPLRRKIFYNFVGVNFEWAEGNLSATKEGYQSARNDNE